MRITGDRVALLAATLVWLAMLAFPVAYGVSGAVAMAVPLLTAVAGVIVVAVVRQAALTRELTVSRRTVERLAGAAERLRLAPRAARFGQAAGLWPRWRWPARGPGSVRTSTWTPLPARSRQYSAS